MKKNLLLIFTVFLAVLLTGCGSSNSSKALVCTMKYNEPFLDGFDDLTYYAKATYEYNDDNKVTAVNVTYELTLPDDVYSFINEQADPESTMEYLKNLRNEELSETLNKSHNVKVTSKINNNKIVTEAVYSLNNGEENYGDIDTFRNSMKDGDWSCEER